MGHTSLIWVPGGSRILDELTALGIEDKTVVVLHGDHGWQLGEHNSWREIGARFERRSKPSSSSLPSSLSALPLTNLLSPPFLSPPLLSPPFLSPPLSLIPRLSRPFLTTPLPLPFPFADKYTNFELATRVPLTIPFCRQVH